MCNSSLIRIAAFILVVVLVSNSVLPVRVHAITWDDVTETFAVSVDYLTLCWYYMTRSDFLTWFDHSESDPGSLLFYCIYSPLNCPKNPNRYQYNSDYAPHEWSPSSLLESIEGDDYCLYCGITFKQFRASVAEEVEFWELARSSASYIPISTGFYVTNVSREGKASYIYDYSGEWKECLKQAYYSGSAVVVGVYGQYMWGYYWDEHGQLVSGLWANPHLQTHSGALGVYSLSELSLLNSGTVSNYPYFSQELAEKSADYDKKTVHAFCWDKPNDGNNFHLYRKLNTDSSWLPDTYLLGITYMTNIHSEFTDIVNSGYVVGSAANYPISAAAVVWSEDYVLTEPEGTTENSRPSGIMDAIQNYNTTNNYIDNSVVNYYIGSFDEDDNLTGYYPMDIYDEQTLVFTEPVTGAQYQTTGWRYDYAARRYTLDLEPGTFSLGDYDILQIKLTYGDEAVTIQYYNELGELVETDEYQYIMVAKEECTLNGHTYSVEVTKDPTCTTPGQQISTCTVCGNQEVHYVPAALGHDWLRVEDQEPSYDLPAGASCPACSSISFSADLDMVNELYSCVCSDCGQAWTADAVVTSGYTLYECSRCGKQQKESDAQKDGLFTSAGNLIADGIVWCTEKLTQLVNSITSMVDTFSSYLDSLADTGGAFPQFLGAAFSSLPEELTNLFWLSLVGLVLLAVWLKWFR